MRFVLDACMSHHHASGLREFGKPQKLEILHLDDLFPAGTADLVWIQGLARSGDAIVVSGDMRITRNPVEKAAWIESGLTGFFFGDAWSEARFWKKATELVEWFPLIAEKAKKHPTGYGFSIPKQGKTMKQIFPEAR